MNNTVISVIRGSWLLAIVSIFVFSNCSDDEEVIRHRKKTIKDNGELADVIEANRFVSDIMETYYYWNNEMPENDYRTERDTKTYFKKLLSKKDRFSFIIDDVETYDKENMGIVEGKGWSLIVYYTEGTNCIGVARYVYEGSPAYKAGVRRGHIIDAVDGEPLTEDNYTELLVTRERSIYNIFYYDREGKCIEYSCEIANAENYEPSLAVDTVFVQPDGSRVGYIFYTSFTGASIDDLVATASKFQSEGITDLILDLRLNNGGADIATKTLCSLIAPKEYVQEEKTLITEHFNSILSSMPEYSDNTNVYFRNDLPVSLNLDRLVVLTSNSTASASEALIWCLRPYMDVITIGETTHGKNSTMFLLRPEHFTFIKTGAPYYDKSIYNWMIAPIVSIYGNCNGESFDTSNGSGIPPDYKIKSFEDLGKSYIYQIGDAEETLTAAALRYLRGEEVILAKNKSMDVDLRQINTVSERSFGGKFLNPEVLAIPSFESTEEEQ